MLWFIVVFIVDLVVSFAWAKSIKAIATDSPVKAALWAGIITLFGAFTIISYNINNWLLIPAVAGSSLGTYLSVKYRKWL